MEGELCVIAVVLQEMFGLLGDVVGAPFGWLISQEKDSD